MDAESYMPKFVDQRSCKEVVELNEKHRIHHNFSLTPDQAKKLGAGMVVNVECADCGWVPVVDGEVKYDLDALAAELGARRGETYSFG